MNNKIEETINRVQRLGLDADIKMDDGNVRHFHHGHEYVEIGGMKWATMNIGATAVTDYGLYFQWGDTQGYTVDQVCGGSGQKYFDGVTWYDYKFTPNGIDFGVAPNYEITKYNATDGKTVLEASDDAVTAAWGGGWRIPTTVEFQALVNAVNAVLTTDYQCSGVNGLVCADKTDPSKVLFFPSAGYAFNGSVEDVGNYGYYWSSSLYSNYVYIAYRLCFNLCFNSSYVDWNNFNGRCFGFPLRGVFCENS